MAGCIGLVVVADGRNPSIDSNAGIPAVKPPPRAETCSKWCPGTRDANALLRDSELNGQTDTGDGAIVGQD